MIQKTLIRRISNSIKDLSQSNSRNSHKDLLSSIRDKLRRIPKFQARMTTHQATPSMAGIGEEMSNQVSMDH